MGRGGKMTYKFRDWYIPERMMFGIRRYIDEHCPAGDFLTAVLQNDLKEACGCADDENLANLPAFVAYLYNEAPSLCWGSPERVEQWLAAREICPICGGREVLDDSEGNEEPCPECGEEKR
jgi:hypothetical protein